MPQPDILKSQTEFNKLLAQRDKKASQQLTARWLEIERRMADDIVKLSKEIADLRAAGQIVKQWRLNRLDRYLKLISQVGDEINKFNIFASQVVTATQRASAKQGLLNASSFLAQVYQLQSGIVGAEFDHLGVGAIKNIVALARAGQPLNTILKRSYPLAVDGFTRELLAGTAIGANPQTTAKKILRKGLSQGLNHTLLVNRDQSIRAYREASRQQYQKSGQVVAYRRLAAKNKRTCGACLALDGTLYKTSDLMPLHPEDRCTMLPVIRGFKPLALETGKQWFLKQTKKTQRQILGPGRLKAFNAGEFSFDKLATRKPNKMWGPSAQVTSLKNLRKGKGGVKAPRL